MNNSLDHNNTTEWALAHVDGVSFVGSVQKFMLANRVTGRAHELYFGGGGLTLGFSKPKGQTKNPDLKYYNFRTKRPVQFSDFDGRGARITAIRLPIYSKTYFIINAELNPLGKKLAKVTMGGLSTPKLSISGQAFVNGVIKISYGDGKPHGLIRRVLDLEDKFTSAPRKPNYSVTPFEEPLIVLPADLMFSSNSHALKVNVNAALSEALILIEKRDNHYKQVVIEGHTDSTGSNKYNMKLSLKRAKAVKQWLIKNGCEGANNFIVEGFGETRPKRSNDSSGERTNKEVRAQNRRVEIRFKHVIDNNGS